MKIRRGHQASPGNRKVPDLSAGMGDAQHQHKMIKVLQANIRRGPETFALLQVMVKEKKVDIVFVSEIGQFKIAKSIWIADNLQKAGAFVVLGPRTRKHTYRQKRQGKWIRMDQEQ